MGAKHVPRGVLLLLLPPRPDKPGLPTAPVADDRRGHGVDDKLATLRNYRHACDLCYRCSEKWSRDNRCPEQIHFMFCRRLGRFATVMILNVVILLLTMDLICSVVLPFLWLQHKVC